MANNSGGDLLGTFAASYSLIKDPSGAQISGSHNLIGADPQLGSLGDHGGPTLCMLPDLGSPVIDALKPCDAQFAFLCTDQRLNTSLQGNRDIGAVERLNPEPIVFRDGFNSE